MALSRWRFSVICGHCSGLRCARETPFSLPGPCDNVRRRHPLFRLFLERVEWLMRDFVNTSDGNISQPLECTLCIQWHQRCAVKEALHVLVVSVCVMCCQCLRLIQCNLCCPGGCTGTAHHQLQGRLNRSGLSSALGTRHSGCRGSCCAPGTLVYIIYGAGIVPA
jgi:hypothetical protein